MNKKYKTTGCFRFFLVIIILAPIAYLGASYYNGENGIENIKQFLNIGQNSSSQSTDDVYKNTGADLQEQIENLENENRKLRREVKEKDAEIKALQKIRDVDGGNQ